MAFDNSKKVTTATSDDIWNKNLEHHDYRKGIIPSQITKEAAEKAFALAVRNSIKAVALMVFNFERKKLTSSLPPIYNLPPSATKAIDDMIIKVDQYCGSYGATFFNQEINRMLGTMSDFEKTVRHIAK